jgi:hypothetical protein
MPVSIWGSIGRIAPLKRLLSILAILAIVTTHGEPGSWNDRSRMATVQSLVESGTFVIDKTSFLLSTGGDKVFINGHFYSDKPPVPAVMGAAVYLPLYHAGLHLHPGWSVAYYLITLLTVKLLWLLGTVALFLALRFTGLSEENRFLVALAFAVGSLYFTWSTVFNSHEIAAALLSIGFYFLLKARFEGQARRNLLVAGFCLSLVATADMPTGIFYALFLLYVLRDPQLRSATAFYLLPLVVTQLPQLAMIYSIHHSFMPVQVVDSYFQYPGSPWNSAEQNGGEQLSGIHVNDARFAVSYGLLALIGPRGFLLYNPVLWIAVWALIRTASRRGPFFHEALVVGVGSMVLVAYYLLFTSNYGGSSYSIRWFVPTLPLLFFFLYRYFELYSPQRVRGFRVLACVSMVIAFVGAVNPWSHDYFSEVPFVANVIELKKDLLPNLSVRQQLARLRQQVPEATPARSAGGTRSPKPVAALEQPEPQHDAADDRRRR